ncbi:MAG: phosphomannomutase/phosphoglucomutase [Alphaproteobacteria bacterium]
MDLSVFKAYDVRGVVPTQLNEQLAYLVGRAYAALAKPKAVAVGRDVRATSQPLMESLMNGLLDGGVNVYDLGLCGTEEVNFAAASMKLGGGIMVTASHNPIQYNGLKILGPHAKTLEEPYGLQDMRRWIEQHHNALPAVGAKGVHRALEHLTPYLDHLTSVVNVASFKPLKLVANCGNGCAGPTLLALQKRLPMLEIVPMFETPDGTFPNGIPNPLLPENRAATTAAVLAHKADLGLAWDGDYDRCFLFDAEGQFVSPYQLGSVLAMAYLHKYPAAKIVHDPRLEWNTRAAITAAGGEAVRVRCGYSFIKKAMREVGAVFGAEASGHFFFADFNFGDSGMLPWLKTVELMSATGQTLAQLVQAANTAAYACDEVNVTLPTPALDALTTLEHELAPQATEVLKIDGLSLTFAEWRCNIRSSNTEPLLRLNVEGKTAALADKHQHALLERLLAMGGQLAGGH